MSESESAAEIEVETVGIDEMVRQERVRSIFKARNSCREMRQKARNESSQGRENLASVYFRSPLEGFVREIEPLLSQTPNGVDLWNDYDFGVVDLRPRLEEVPGEPNTSQRIGSGKILNQPRCGIELPVHGLRSLFDLESPLRAYFDVLGSSKRRGSTGQIKEVIVERQLPLTTLDEMFAATNRYLAEIGFGVNVQEAQKNTKLDDDLLQEVEQWRRENL